MLRIAGGPDASRPLGKSEDVLNITEKKAISGLATEGTNITAVLEIHQN